MVDHLLPRPTAALAVRLQAHAGLHHHCGPVGGRVVTALPALSGDRGQVHRPIGGAAGYRDGDHHGGLRPGRQVHRGRSHGHLPPLRRNRAQVNRLGHVGRVGERVMVDHPVAGVAAIHAVRFQAHAALQPDDDVGAGRSGVITPVLLRRRGRDSHRVRQPLAILGRRVHGGGDPDRAAIAAAQRGRQGPGDGPANMFRRRGGAGSGDDVGQQQRQRIGDLHRRGPNHPVVDVGDGVNQRLTRLAHRRGALGDRQIGVAGGGLGLGSGRVHRLGRVLTGQRGAPHVHHVYQSLVRPDVAGHLGRDG